MTVLAKQKRKHYLYKLCEIWKTTDGGHAVIRWSEINNHDQQLQTNGLFKRMLVAKQNLVNESFKKGFLDSVLGVEAEFFWPAMQWLEPCKRRKNMTKWTFVSDLDRLPYQSQIRGQYKSRCPTRLTSNQSQVKRTGCVFRPKFQGLNRIKRTKVWAVVLFRLIRGIFYLWFYDRMSFCSQEGLIRGLFCPETVWSFFFRVWVIICRDDFKRTKYEQKKLTWRTAFSFLIWIKYWL